MLTDEQMVEFEAAEAGVRKAEAAYLACPTDAAGAEGHSLLTAYHLAVCRLNALRWRHGSAAVAEVRRLRAELAAEREARHPAGTYKQCGCPLTTAVKINAFCPTHLNVMNDLPEEQP